MLESALPIRMLEALPHVRAVVRHPVRMSLDCTVAISVFSLITPLAPKLDVDTPTKNSAWRSTKYLYIAKRFFYLTREETHIPVIRQETF